MQPTGTPSATPIKTLHISNYYHSSSGGIRTFYQALLGAADRHRREVRVVVPGLKNAVEDAGAFGKIYTIKAPRSPLFDSCAIVSCFRIYTRCLTARGCAKSFARSSRTWSRSATSTRFAFCLA